MATITSFIVTFFHADLLDININRVQCMQQKSLLRLVLVDMVS